MRKQIFVLAVIILLSHSASAFKFVHITDTHYWDVFHRLPNPTSQAKFYNATALIREINPDFVVGTGDDSMTKPGGGGFYRVTTQAQADERYQAFTDAIYQELPFPFYYSLGNHDGELDLNCYNFHCDYVMDYSTTARLNYLPLPNSSSALENYYSFDYGDATLIFLDTYRYSSNPNGIKKDTDWTLGKEQFEWLNQTLSTSTKQWKFIFGHHIVGGAVGDGSANFHYGDGGGNYSQSGNESYGQVAINKLMEKYNAQFYVYGHVHMFAHDWANWSAYNKTKSVNYIAGASTSQSSCNSPDRTILYDNEICATGFTLFEVSPNNVTFSLISDTDGSVLYTYTVRRLTLNDKFNYF